jgi:hypothetical protein
MHPSLPDGPTAAIPFGGQPRRAAALLLAAFAGACVDTEERPPPPATGRPIRGCEGFSYQPCDILSAGCQRELFELVACLRGESGTSEPPLVRQLDEADAIALLGSAPDGSSMTDGVDAMSARMFDERAFRLEVRGLELMGLLAPALIQEPSDVIEETIGDVLAYYRPSIGDVVIIDRGEPVDDLFANSVLAHELVHALQDTRHDLAAFGATEMIDADGILARDSVVEGEASLYQYLLLFAYEGVDLARLSFPSFFADLASFGVELTLEAGSPALSASSIFPYTFGTVYAGTRWLSGGSAALDALYQSPPRTSWEVLGGVPDAAHGADFGTPPAALDGYELVVSDVAGAWISVAMLAGLDSGSAAAVELPELAARWTRDRYWVYASAEEPPAVAVVWAIDWADSASAARFAELARPLAPAGAVLRIDTMGSSTRLVAVERADDLEPWRARLAERGP